MQEVKVSKEALLGKLKMNRSSHREIFLKAQEGYRKKIIEELDVMMAEACIGKRIRRGFEFPEPIDQTADYDRAIAMLEMSLEDEIVLSESDFACYVLDNWGWKDMVGMTNSRYL